MIVAALKRIEDALSRLAADAEHEAVDGYRLSVLARQVAAQREMLEKGLVE